MQFFEASSTLTSEITLSSSDLPKRKGTENLRTAENLRTGSSLLDTLFSQPKACNVSRQHMLNIRMHAHESRNFNEYGDDLVLLLDRLDTMRQQECNQYAHADIVSNQPRQKYIFSPARERGQRLMLLETNDHRFDGNNGKIDAYCREQMCLWCFRLIDHFDLSREFVSISMSYVDRFLSIFNCDRATYKLTCITALYIACKIHGTRKGIALLPEGLAALSLGEFTTHDIFALEFVLLKAFQWQFLHPPTANTNAVMMGFLFFSAMPVYVAVQKIIDIACFLTEIATCDFSLATYNPSVVAFASLLLAMNRVPQEEISFKERIQLRFTIAQVFRRSKWSMASIQEVKGRLIELYKESDEFFVQQKHLRSPSQNNAKFRKSIGEVMQSHESQSS